MAEIFESFRPGASGYIFMWTLFSVSATFAQWALEQASLLLRAESWRAGKLDKLVARPGENPARRQEQRGARAASDQSEMPA